MRSLNSLTLSCPRSFSVYPVTFPVSVRLPLVLCHSVAQPIGENNSANEHVLTALYSPYADIQTSKVLNLQTLRAVQMSCRKIMAITNNGKM